ncbi:MULTISPECIES: hypothetical protein [unclassified Roseofilum]|uniref:hypothetical protein n=1 Tax=unclassified Roseofilum TaxID=2620099 RepID=UPI001B2F7A11|nr:MULTISPECIES: hypothetical protein [unclassified Roseofilum]MBP0009944.1 hypothetical protein [Roseofilum sp. Belize Diploria]MBP0034074.1 hypothetical protein [Roseofilum sp. Belize BBD 4]
MPIYLNFDLIAEAIAHLESVVSNDWLTEAQQRYRTLGYTQKLEEIRKELRILE